MYTTATTANHRGTCSRRRPAPSDWPNWAPSVISAGWRRFGMTRRRMAP